jgi:hypothetical protein
MASRASARRYARALFDVVSKSGDVDAALAELKALGGAISGHADLRRALTSPGVPLGAKQTVMREVLALQPVSKVVARLITLIVENDDIDEIEEIAAVGRQAPRHRGVTGRCVWRARGDHAARRSGHSRWRRRQGRQPRLRRQHRPSSRPHPRPSRER